MRENTIAESPAKKKDEIDTILYDSLWTWVAAGWRCNITTLRSARPTRNKSARKRCSFAPVKSDFWTHRFCCFTTKNSGVLILPLTRILKESLSYILRLTDFFEVLRNEYNWNAFSEYKFHYSISLFCYSMSLHVVRNVNGRFLICIDKSYIINMINVLHGSTGHTKPTFNKALFLTWEHSTWQTYNKQGIISYAGAQELANLQYTRRYGLNGSTGFGKPTEHKALCLTQEHANWQKYSTQGVMSYTGARELTKVQYTRRYVLHRSTRIGKPTIHMALCLTRE